MEFGWICNFYELMFLCHFFPELHPPQPLPPQPLHARPERRHRQVLVVDDQPRREAGQGGQAPGHQHGDPEVREEAGPGQEEGGGPAQRGHPVPELLCPVRGPGPVPGVAPAAPRVPAEPGLQAPGLVQRQQLRREAVPYPGRRVRHARERDAAPVTDPVERGAAASELRGGQCRGWWCHGQVSVIYFLFLVTVGFYRPCLIQCLIAIESLILLKTIKKNIINLNVLNFLRNGHMNSH